MTVDTKEDDEFIFIINKIKLNNLFFFLYIYNLYYIFLYNKFISYKIFE